MYKTIEEMERKKTRVIFAKSTKTIEKNFRIIIIINKQLFATYDYNDKYKATSKYEKYCKKYLFNSKLYNKIKEFLGPYI